MREISEQDIQSLYYGSLFTACGGGEYSDHLPTIVEKTIMENGPVKLLSIDELPEDARFLAVGVLGSMLEANLQTGREGMEVLKRLSEKLDYRFDGLFTIEGSSINILFPILVASLVGVPIVDGDCMGRAFPEFQMTTAQAMGKRVVPMSILTPGSEYHHFEDMDNLIFEAGAREIVSHEIGIAYFSGFPNSGRDLREILLPGTLSFVREIGSTFLEPDSYSRLLKDITEITKNSLYGGAVELFVGTLEEIETTVEGGRSWISIGLKGTGDYLKSDFTILAQNECLLAYRDKQISAMVPDLIILIDLRTLIPVSLSALQENMKVAVLGIPAPVRLKSRDMLNAIGPACFGYNEEYTPIEGIHYARFYS